MIAPAENFPYPEWIDAKLIAETIATWSPKYGRTLTTAEALEILQNFVRTIDFLQD